MSKKIKNPEKYIALLKKKLKWAKETNEFLQIQKRKKEGIVLVIWKEYEQEQSTDNSLNLLNLRPGDRVMIMGEVIHVEGSRCKEGNLTSKIKYLVKETRKLEP